MIGVIVTMFVAGFLPPVRRALVDMVHWCASSGPAGVIVYALLYTVSTLLVLPAAILTAAAGWAWGLVDGCVIVLGVSLVADWIPFAIARRLGRERVAVARRHGTVLRVLDEAFRTQGFVLVALLRLSPIAPYNVTNYLLGLMPVSTTTYLVASTIGSLPSLFVIVYAGTLVSHASDLGAISEERVMIAMSLVASVTAFLGITLIARRALRRIVALEVS